MNIVIGLFLLAGLVVVIGIFVIAAMSHPQARRRTRDDSSDASPFPFYGGGHTASVAGSSDATGPHGMPNADHRVLDSTSHHHHVGDPAWDTSGGAASDGGSFESGSAGDGGGGGGGGGGGDGGGGGGD